MKFQSLSLKGLLLALPLLLIHEFISAQQQSLPVDPTFYESYSWRNIGPNRGGRSLGSSGSPGRPNEYYFGATGGGLWKTVDGGNEWFPVTDGQISSSSIGAVAIAETNPDIVYIHTTNQNIIQYPILIL